LYLFIFCFPLAVKFLFDWFCFPLPFRIFRFPLPGKPSFIFHYRFYFIELISTHYYFSAMFSTTDFIFHYCMEFCNRFELVLISTSGFIFHYWFCFPLGIFFRHVFHYQFPPCFPLVILFSTSHLVFYLRSVLYYR
jgi:hypothetical protein